MYCLEYCRGVGVESLSCDVVYVWSYGDVKCYSCGLVEICSCVVVYALSCVCM